MKIGEKTLSRPFMENQSVADEYIALTRPSHFIISNYIHIIVLSNRLRLVISTYCEA